jgi:transposase
VLVNALRAHLGEFGIVAGVGRNRLEKFLRVPREAGGCLLALRDQLALAKQQILEADRRILVWHRSSKLSHRLDRILCVGPLIAAAWVASIPDP